MERMTKKVDGVWTALCKYGGSPHPVVTQETIDRLAAYEETGLEPEDIKQACTEEAILKLAGQSLGITPDRLRELAEADREGRCVVLPCKRDDTLWTYCNYPKRKVYSFKVTDISTLNGRTMLNTDILSVIDARDIGKTVFLTREAAETALAEKGAGNG